jgi:uncharacterized protein
MKWQGRRQSSNVEDRRGTVVRGAAIGGGLGGAGIIITLVILLLTYCTGGSIGDITDSLNNSQITSSAADQTSQATAKGGDELGQFVKVVFADTEDVWTEIFTANNMTYTYPGLVLYTDYVESGCGSTGSSVGPFYCPEDQKVYIDLSFYQELQDRFQAPGDFAMAYVVAHEVGHHIQTLLGIMKDVSEVQSTASEAVANEYSVRLELQADYLAGVWTYYVNKWDYLEQGDIEEALNAASAVGDDRIQQKQMGYVNPDSFTHGTSEQRQRWFSKGFASGSLENGDTFSANEL